VAITHRVELSRSRGLRLAPNARSVAYPTKWANPFRPTKRSADANAAAQYPAYLSTRPDLIEQARAQLAGRDLACWCPLVDEDGSRLPCHADVLLRIADGSTLLEETLHLDDPRHSCSVSSTVAMYQNIQSRMPVDSRPSVARRGGRYERPFATMLDAAT
jgi:hypothetical protein